MKKLCEVFGNNRGEGYIDVVVSVLVSMMIIVLALNVFIPYNKAGYGILQRK